MEQERCSEELQDIVWCEKGWWCRSRVEKGYVNCVIRHVCPSFARALEEGDCVKRGTLDLRTDASDACRSQWTRMDGCLQRSTTSSLFDLSSLASREK